MIIALIVGGSILVITLLYSISVSNEQVELEERIRNLNASMHVLAGNRSKLVADLSTIVSAWLGHEKEIMMSIKEIRAVFYKYPNLKDKTSVILMNKLDELETQILEAKIMYNNEITRYNTFIKLFPINILSWTRNRDFKYCDV